MVSQSIKIKNQEHKLHVWAQSMFHFQNIYLNDFACFVSMF